MTFAEEAKAKLAALNNARPRTRGYAEPPPGDAEVITTAAKTYQVAAHEWWRIRTGQQQGDAGRAKRAAAVPRERLYDLLVAARKGRVAYPISLTRDWQRLVIGESKDYGIAGGATLEGKIQRMRFGRMLGRLNYYARKAGVIKR